MAAASKRLTKTALTLLKPSVSRARSLASFSNSRPKKLPLIDNIPFNFSTVALSRHYYRKSFFPGMYHSSSLIDKLEFTKMEWEGITNLIFEARLYNGVAEPEDFMKGLLRKENGLAGRIFSKAGLDNTSILEAICCYPKDDLEVEVDTSPLKVGEHLNTFFENAIKHKKDMKDEFVSVEHFILAYHMDKRFGQQLFTNFGLSEKGLRDAIDAVRGSQKRELSEHWGIEKELMNQIRTLKEEIDRVNVEIESTERAATLVSLHRQLEEAEKHLAQIVSKWAGTRFEEALHQGVVGQNMAVRSVADAIRRSRAGLSDPNRPVASFMFMGSAGVGKKTLVNTLADYLFNTEETFKGYPYKPVVRIFTLENFLKEYLYKPVVRIDMGECMGKPAVSRLLVALGDREKEKEVLVQLTELVRHIPYCVLLFEEIEKAPQDVLSVLLEVLDNGRITDCEGKTVCFKNTVIIMTSKIGSHLIQDTLSSNTHDTQEVVYDIMKRKVLDLARETFRPEFMNCIDECVVFKPMDASEIRNLAEIWMRRWKEELKQYRVELHYTEEAIDVVGRLFYDPNFVKMGLNKYFMEQLERKMLTFMRYYYAYREVRLVKVDVNSDLCLGLLTGDHCEASHHYQIYFVSGIECSEKTAAARLACN